MVVIAHRARIMHGSLLETLQIGHVMEEAARREPGCITYKIYLDPTDPNTLFIFEEWTSQEALDHFRSSGGISQTFQEHLARQLSAPIHSQRYEVAAVTPT